LRSHFQSFFFDLEKFVKLIGLGFAWFTTNSGTKPLLPNSAFTSASTLA